MKKTISQRFFLSLCLMIVGCLWGSAAWATSVTYSFSITPTDFNGDSYDANNKVHTTTAVCTTNRLKTMEVTWYSNQVMLKSGAMQWQAKKGYIYNETDLGTIQSVTVTSSEGTFTTYYGTKQNPTSGTTVGGGFFKVKVGGATGKTTKVTVTFVVEESSDPELITSANSISFGSVVKESSKEQSLTISGTNLTADADLEITGTDAAMFSVSTTTITATDGNIAPKDVTVTYTPTVTGDHSATLNISSGNLIKKVTLTGTGFVPHYISATTYYKKITSSDELADGGQYVIVYTKGKKGLLAGANNVHNATPADVVFEDNGTITTANAAAMTEITFEKYSTNTYHLKIGDNKYIKATSSTSSKTDLNVATDKDNNALWTIDFDAEGNVEITSVAYKTRGIFYKTTNSFKNYAISNRGDAGYPAIQLYQKVGEMPIAKATGYVSTYVADFAYVMPKHITGHTVTLAAEQGVISTKKVFRAGDEVPALTPLLIKSDEDYAAEENSRNYHPAVLNKTVKAYKDDNMLEYRRTAANLTNTMKNESVYYYKLAIKEGKVGFYWGADNGAAFKMTKPSTAYLTVPQSTSVQGFVLNLEEGEPTGIATVVTNEDAPIYNLQGIRMNGKNLPKGIYIQGGKKFMVK